MAEQRPISFQVEWFAQIPSSSALLLERAGQANFHGTIISAREQTQGKGRRGRTWQTGQGNLAFSIGFAVPAHLGPELLAYYPLCVGISVHRAVAALIEQNSRTDLTLKWPNDLAYRHKKLMGLLSQARTQDGFTYLSIGVGLNVAWCPPELPAIALNNLPLLESCSREELLEKIVAEMQNSFSRWQDFAFVKKEWESRATYLGHRVFYGLLEEEDNMRPAIALGLDRSGALLVRHEDGSEALLSTEDLSLRFERLAR